MSSPTSGHARRPSKTTATFATRPSRKRTRQSLVAAALLLSVALVPTPQARAAGDVVLANGCVVVASPTAKTFTSCPGTDFTGLQGALKGNDLSYAQLAGATFGGAAALESVNFTGADLSNVTFNLASSYELNLTGANLAGALLPTGNGYITAPNLDLSVLNPAQLAAGRDLNFYYGNVDGLTSRDMTVDASLYVISASASGLDLSGSTFNGETSFNFMENTDGANVSGVTFNGNASFMESPFDDSNFSNTIFRGDDNTLGGMKANHADFSGVQFLGKESNLGGFFGEGLDFTGGVIDTGTSNRNSFSWAGSFLTGADFTGAKFLGSEPIGFGGTELNDADFTGATFDNATVFNGATALRATFRNAIVTKPIAARGMWLTSSDWRGATFTMSDPEMGQPDFTGAIFAFADLSGVTLPMIGSGTYFSDANLKGATIDFTDSRGGNLFHRTNLEGATLSETNPGRLNGSQFRNANLDGAVLNFTDLSGVSIVDSTMVGATLNAQVLGGLVIARTDATGAIFPAARNATSDPLKWLYGQMWIDSELKDTSVAPLDVAGVSATGAPVVVPFQAGTAWDNADGQDPFAADGSYWWGSGIECDYANGSAFPVGQTTVTCDVGFKHSGTNEGVWDTAPFSWTMPAGGGRSSLYVSGLGADPTQASFAKDQAWPKGEMVPSAYDGYLYGDLHQSGWYDTDQIQVSSLPLTFNVDVEQSPTSVARDYVGLVGDAVDIGASAVGYPAANVVVTGLPAGVSYTTGVSGVTTSVVLSGAATTAGEYAVTVTGTNAVGTHSVTVTVSIFDPNAQAVPSKIKPGGFTVVTGNGFHPNTEAVLFAEDGTPMDDVDATTTSALGVAVFDDVVLETEGTFRFLIKGAGGLEALSNEVVVGDLELPVDVIVTPASPTFLPAMLCGLEGTVVLPEMAGVSYTSSREGAVVTVAAAALDGFVLAESATSTWEFVIPAAVPCVTDPSPEPELPTDEPSPELTVPAAPAPTPAVSAPAPTPTVSAPAPTPTVEGPQPSPALATTGSSAAAPIAGLAFILAAGGACLLTARRRRTRSALPAGISTKQ